MLKNKLPLYVDPDKLCRSDPIAGVSLAGQFKVSDLLNLKIDLSAQQGAIVEVSLLFSMDKAGLCCVTGSLKADLHLVCQRCLQSMIYRVDIPIQVSPVASDQQAARLPAEYEPLWVPEGEISMAEWIAEEIHLALPLAPCHEPTCLPGSNFDIK